MAAPARFGPGVLLFLQVAACAPLDSFLPSFLPRPAARERELRRREIAGSLEALVRGTPDERAQARARLEALGEEARPELQLRARYGFPEQAIPAANVMARRPDPSLTDFFADLLVRHPDAAVRRHMADLLANTNDGAALPALARALRHDPAATVRVASARALGTLRHPLARGPLTEALDDPHFDVVLAAHRALEQLAQLRIPDMPRDPVAFRARARELWRDPRIWTTGR